jgi:hypothetical protein
MKIDLDMLENYEPTNFFPESEKSNDRCFGLVSQLKI